MRAFAFTLLALLTLAPGLAEAAPRAADLVKAELVADRGTIRPGETFTVGVRLRMKPGWHTYWRNPGDSGLATEVAWTLPPGFEAGPIAWPAPSRILVAHLVNFGYEGEATLLVPVTAPASLALGREVELKALVTFLVCERECIPGEATVATRVRGAGGGEAAPGGALDAARAAIPTRAPWASRVEARDGALTLVVEAPGLSAGSVRSAFFFPYDENALEHAAEQAFAIRPDGIALTLTRSPTATGPAPPALGGVLAIEEALDGGVVRQAVEIGPAPPAPAPSAAGAPAAAAAPTGGSSLSTLLNAALLAFAGGLLLNLMPCVFPVLSIKVLSLVRHAGGSAAAVRAGGLAYAAGVLVTFLALAGLLLALRAGGAEIGWGYQLQSPAVVAGLAFLMLALGLSLSGVATFGASLAGIGSGLADRGGPAGSFWTGALAAVVATPCTAPFMGAAVGYALTAPAPAALSVFAALGLGMAAPFLLLTLRPSLLARLPRPGRWMEVLKQALAFPVYATAAWLLAVVAAQVGPDGVFAALLGLVLVGFAVWALGAAQGAAGAGRRAGFGAAAVAAVAAVALAATLEERRPEPPAGAGVAAAPGAPAPFTQARLDALRAEGRPVFLNMTAAWCVTCLVNERTALGSAAVRDAMAARDVAYLKGDWTSRDPEITRLLERHGRSGVPLYLAYPPRGEPILLPQILTAAPVLDALERVAPVAAKRAALDPPASRR